MKTLSKDSFKSLDRQVIKNLLLKEIKESFSFLKK